MHPWTARLSVALTAMLCCSATSSDSSLVELMADLLAGREASSSSGRALCQLQIVEDEGRFATSRGLARFAADMSR